MFAHCHRFSHTKCIVGGALQKVLIATWLGFYSGTFLGEADFSQTSEIHLLNFWPGLMQTYLMLIDLKPANKVKTSPDHIGEVADLGVQRGSEGPKLPQQTGDQVCTLHPATYIWNITWSHFTCAHKYFINCDFFLIIIRKWRILCTKSEKNTNMIYITLTAKKLPPELLTRGSEPIGAQPTDSQHISPVPAISLKL